MAKNMENRIKAYEPSKVSEDFSNFFLYPQLNLFQGPQNIEELVTNFIKYKEEKARKEGAEETIKSIITAIRQEIDGYIGLITKIVDFVYDAAPKKIGSADFKIEEIRTNFCFETKAINVLFIIDANLDNGKFSFIQETFIRRYPQEVIGMMKKKSNIIGIIPGRMASSRFPGKPLVKIQGIPMIGHVYFRSMMCKSLDSIYIATCDEEIARYAASIGCEAIMTADTHERASDRAKEAILKIELETGKKTDIAVMIQGDEPMLYPEMIDEVIRPLIEDDSVSVSNLMAPLKTEEEENDPNVVKVVIDSKSDALYFSRESIPSRKKSKTKPIMYKQIAIIPFRRDMLIRFNELKPMPLENIESIDMLRLLEHGYKVRMVPTKFEIYGVDTPDDREKVERLMDNDVLFKKYQKAIQV